MNSAGNKTTESAKEMHIIRMRCEYLDNPCGVDVIKPRLNWALESCQRGQKQTAYQIVVVSDAKLLDDDNGDLWDTGKVVSDETLHVEYSGNELVSGIRCYWKVRVWDKNGEASAWSDPGTWSMGLLDRKDWKAQWIVDAELASFPDAQASAPAAMLRKSFDIREEITRATVYATAAGVYDLHINGQRVGDHILAPEWTAYDKRFQYQTYDVTGLLTKGGNAIGANLGEGWYVGRIGGDQFHGRHNYGSYPRLLVQIEIELADGTTQTIVSDGSWCSSTAGPIRFGDVFDGEIYDARREMPGWDTPGFDQQCWKPVHVEPIEDSDNLVCQPNQPIRVVKELKPIAITEPTAGSYIFDMGQNMAGWCRIAVHGKPDSIVTLRHGEVTKPDGTLFTENIDAAAQTDRYILRGDKQEVFEPHFTYHGFRYVEVTGLTYQPALEDLTGVVFHSAAPDVGSFESSNEIINKLMSNIVWTQRSNMHGIPTDCPQRGERRGWQGDLQAFSQTASFNMDMSAFFKKCIDDIRDEQLPDGRYSNFTPRPKTFVYDEKDGDTAGYGVPAWADAGTIVPWRMYQNYADKRLIAEHFESAKRWSNWVHCQNPNGLWLIGRSRDYSDWLNSDEFEGNDEPAIRGAVPHEILATAFFAHSTQIVAKMAEVLGKKKEAEQYSQRFEHIKAAFNKAFVDPGGRIDKDTQAGYALALRFDLIEGQVRQKAAEHLARTTKEDTGHLSTGIQATHRAMLELTRNGYHAEACRLINLRTFPSWGYMIDHGATTIWERWDGYIQGRIRHDSLMNSFNHWALGSVGEWVWRHIAGINPDDEQPGFKHFVIHPQPGQNITWAKSRHDCIRGPIVCNWRLDDDHFFLDLTVPANTTATVHLPATDIANVIEGGVPVTQAQGVEFLKIEADSAVFMVQSGQYAFQSH